MGLSYEDAVRAGIGHLHPESADTPLPIGNEAPTPKAGPPAADAMNGLERRYAGVLDARKAAGEVWRYDFQEVKFRIADDTWYTPDFVVYLADGSIEIHETKGFMRDDAAVKVKAVAAKFPFPVVVVRWVKKAWEFERFEGKRR